MTTTCPHCGRADARPFQVLSRHATPEGETLWTRCTCGSLQARVLDDAGVRVVSRGRPSGLPASDPAVA